MNRFIKSCLFIFLMVLFFLFSRNEIIAVIVVGINAPPSNNIAGQEFDTSFTASGVAPGSSYYGKSLGGEDFTKIDTFNAGGWYQQNSAWTYMPQFTSNTEGTVSGTIKSKFDTNITSGNQQFKIRVRRVDDDTNYDSEIITINVTVPTPSPTISPTEKPKTPTPIPLNSPQSTKSPTPKPTKSPTSSPTPTDTKEVLSESTEMLDPTPEPLKILENEVKDDKGGNNFAKIAGSIIVLGILLIGASGYMAYKIRYNNGNAKES